MNSRTFTADANEHTRELIEVLTNEATDPTSYRKVMHELGLALSAVLAKALATGASPKEVCLACTVEDADYLARGLLEGLEQHRPELEIRFSCFWNKPSIDPYEFDDLDIAPIIKSYKEPAKKECALVIVKSIISGGCVVATNITNLISDLEPTQIIIAAPIMLVESADHLQRHFGPELARRFEYIKFAIDTERGSGPSVYKRYGWTDASDKNKTVPDLVRSRRRERLAAMR